MRHSIILTDDQRHTLLMYVRGHFPPAWRLRAHILLLLADGHTWATIAAVLYCSSRTIALWKTRFEHGGTAALFGTPPGPRRRLGWIWAAVVVAWVKRLTPRSFGLCRSRWCCAALALLLWRLHGVAVSR